MLGSANELRLEISLVENQRPEADFDNMKSFERHFR